MTGKIFDIKKFAVHDGEGIRTTVFFKGCPLSCIWCHNPESISAKPEVEYIGGKCLDCASCVAVCKNGAHAIEDGHHSYNRAACVACGECVAPCLGEALSLWGKEMTVDEVFDIAMEDVEFYETSNGGVTLSGGECLLQADFCAELLRKLKERGINCNVDTCGYVDKSAIDKVAPFTDTFLYDLKAVDSDVHAACTGVPNALILENLRFLDSVGASVEIRIPFVPGYNDGELPAMAEFLKDLHCVKKVRVLAYHNYAGSKYAALGMENTLPSRIPTAAELAAAEELLRNAGLPVA